MNIKALVFACLASPLLLSSCASDKVEIYDDTNFVIVEQAKDDGFYQTKVLCKDKDYFCHELNLFLEATVAGENCPEALEYYPAVWGSVWQENLGENFFVPVGCSKETQDAFNALLAKYDIRLIKANENRLRPPEEKVEVSTPEQISIKVEKYKQVYVFHRLTVNATAGSASANNTEVILQENSSGDWLSAATTYTNDEGVASFDLDGILNTSGEKAKAVTIRVIASSNEKVVSPPVSLTLQAH